VYGLGASYFNTPANFGRDYYIYLGFNSNSPDIPCVITSANATAPTNIAGFTVNNTRKIGGFHFGAVRKVNGDWCPIGTNNQPWSTGWESNIVGAALIGGYAGSIVPNSVWDLQNRPICSPEGFVKLGDLWASIYPLSVLGTDPTFDTSGELVGNGHIASRYGQLPVTGTSGFSAYTFNEILARDRMRLPSYTEWLRAAYGNPGGQSGANDYGWTSASNTDICRSGVRVATATGIWSATGVKPYAVSAFNCCDCVGNVSETLADTYTSYTSFSADAGWSWAPLSSSAAVGRGLLWENYGLKSLVAGGNVYNGVNSGPRAINATNYMWNVNPFIGVRGFCGAL
jgi:hypothetical protein